MPLSAEFLVLCCFDLWKDVHLIVAFSFSLPQPLSLFQKITDSPAQFWLTGFQETWFHPSGHELMTNLFVPAGLSSYLQWLDRAYFPAASDSVNIVYICSYMGQSSTLIISDRCWAYGKTFRNLRQTCNGKLGKLTKGKQSTPSSSPRSNPIAHESSMVRSLSRHPNASSTDCYWKLRSVCLLISSQM